MRAGASYPRHRHADTEELFVLDGDLTISGKAMGPGDYCAAVSGTRHGIGHTTDGCMVLVCASHEDEIVTEVEPLDRSGISFVLAAERSWHEIADAGHVSPIFMDPVAT
jgi:uncharacterized cupin superfamily protein